MLALQETIRPSVEEMLFEAEDDIKNERVAPIRETFDDLRKILQEG